jgi:hypothetical protein
MTAPQPIARSLRALLTGIIDYAGLFPPAALGMAATVRHYAKERAGPDAWMLGRLIVPVARLDEFEREATRLLPREPESEPWLISALASPAGDARLRDDLQRITVFNEKHAEADAGSAVIDLIELRAESAAAIDEAIHQLPEDFFAFFEIPIEEDPRGLVAALVGGGAGAKVRTGGPRAANVPSPQHLAQFIAACASAEVPFKATAGLHHPLRHESRAIGGPEFGFLNVFLAACLARQGASAADLASLLTESSPDAVEIDDLSIGWREHRFRLDQIESCREQVAASFGSCSFDEPRQFLRDLGLM